MWNHAKNLMKKLERANSLFLQCEISSAVLKLDQGTLGMSDPLKWPFLKGKNITQSPWTLDEGWREAVTMIDDEKQYAKGWETMNNYEKQWETMRNFEKRSEMLRNHEKTWEIDEKHWWEMVRNDQNDEKQWEAMRNNEKQWETMRHNEKQWDTMLKDEKQ